MTAPEFDGKLAWVISEWNDDTAGMANPTQLTRVEIESLTKFLTAKGYSKSNKGGGLSDLFGKVEDLGGILVDEFGPIAEALRKRK